MNNAIVSIYYDYTVADGKTNGYDCFDVKAQH